MRLLVLSQFHENEAVVAWWRMRFGSALAWLTPPRRRAARARGALWILPTFARRFKEWPKLRLFAAVFAAAFVGDMYYHILMREDLVTGNAWAVWQTFHSRLFYCLLLTVGLYVSMLREQRDAGAALSAGPVRRLVRIAGVWTFFAVICIWNVKSSASFGPRTTFFFSLFGFG